MRVLIVEDEPRLAQTLRRGLELEGIVVVTASTGDEGLHTALCERFDVLVLDIMLPGVSGYEIVRQVRARQIWTPILMLTAKDGEYDQADAFDLGADDYLTKPFSFVVLIARLRALMRRGAPARPVTLTVDTLEVDPARRTVNRGGVEIALTPREFGLLEYFVRNPDIVLSKTEILRNVWDEYYHGDDNVVEVYVGYLRRKIDAPFDTRSIVTVRGVGYRFTSEHAPK